MKFLHPSSGQWEDYPFQEKIFEYRGYRIPERMIWATGAGPDRFEADSLENLRGYCQHIGLMPFHSVVDIGCGAGRDTIGLESYLDAHGSYIGLDINKDIIDWLSENIKAKNFSFKHCDIEHDFYATNQKKKFADYKYPVDDECADKVIVNSVMTHLLEDDAVHLLREIKRILRPERSAFVTINIVSGIHEHVPDPINDFIYEVGDRCFSIDKDNPTMFVGYTQDKIKEMVERAGLAMIGEFRVVRQNAMVLSKK